ncbi:MAG: serine/threonine-protein kinase [Planctomycetota bacterium]
MTEPAPDDRADAAPVEPASRRDFYESLLGGAIGGRYQLERLVDFGSMGAVFAARHKSDEEAIFAVKILDPELSRRDRRYVQRFVREARILEDTDHPNIVKVFEHGRYEPPGADQPLYYYVMELVEGPDGTAVTLHRHARIRNLRMEDVVYLTSQILSGLRHVHERGVIHRDLKPWNVLVTRDGTCKIVDFGLAKIPDSDLTDVDELFGSQEYIAPELYYRGARKATPGSDIFAVGRIFADLVDHVDFAGTRAGVFASKAAALKYLDELLKRLVDEDPKLRFASAGNVLEVLEKFQESTRIRATVASSARLDKAQVIAAAARRRWIASIARWVLDYALFVVGIAILPIVWAKSPAVGALLAGSLVTSKLWSALSHPPDRHPIAIVVKALAGRLNRTFKDGDFHVLYYGLHTLSLGGPSYRPRHVSQGHRRQFRTLKFAEGVGPVGLAARARSSVILHSVPQWGSEAYKDLFSKHLRVPEATRKLFDPTRRGHFCVPIFRIVRERQGLDLKVVGILAVNTRDRGAMLRTEVARAIREYAAVIQDVIEPVHGSSVREIIVGGAAPIETILINGLEPRVPPIERRMTFEPGAPDAG